MKKPKKIRVIVEKTNTGYSAYAADYPVFTTGETPGELNDNIFEALSLYFEDEKVDRSSINFELDLKQFFNHYKILNSKTLAKRIGMNPTLLSQYARGHKKPSEKQTLKIIYGINKIGQELAEMKLIYEPTKPEFKAGNSNH
jgi:predicted RNase H-like HicB family nuclease